MKHEAHLKNEEETIRFGMILGQFLHGGGRVYIKGNLGSGKTTLARAIIRNACNISGDIPSPTFNLVQSYVVADFEIWHFDLYRLNSKKQQQHQ